MRIGAVIQARCGSSRLANKVLLKLPIKGSKTVLGHIISNAQQSNVIDEIIVATTTSQQDDPLADLVTQARLFRGDEFNVLDRFLQAAKQYSLDIIVRLTGDNPCLDAKVIDLVVANHIEQGFCYSQSVSLPLGCNIEVMSFSALERAANLADNNYQLEHVTPYIRENSKQFLLGEMVLRQSLSITEAMEGMRLTLDYPSDYALLNIIFSELGNKSFSLSDLSVVLDQYPWLVDINKNYQKTIYASEAQEMQAAYQLLKQLDLIHAANMFKGLL